MPVEVRCPAYDSEPETWMLVTPEYELPSGDWVVRGLKFKWARNDPWEPYTGIPLVVATPSASGPWTWKERWDHPE